MAQFKQGRSGNPKGRPKGRPNKVTLEVRDLAKHLVENTEYRRRLETRLLKGTLPPALEAMLWHYAHGKPKDFVEHSGSIKQDLTDYTKMPHAELMAKAREQQRRLNEFLGPEKPPAAQA